MQSGHLLTFPGTRAGFAQAFDDFRRTLDDHPLERRARYNCELVFEEVVTNIIRHGYPDNGEHDIEVSLDFPDDEVIMRFEDDGVLFDPRNHQPALSSSILDGKDDGRGLILLRSAARRLEYERTAQQRNRLTVTIKENE
jgi:serine/threonine-protein kinase RsbW